VVIKYIRKLGKSGNNSQRNEILSKMNEEVNELMKDQQERVILEYFHLTAWIQSKLKKQAFSNSVEEINKIS
jgi:hypothetical protein